MADPLRIVRAADAAAPVAVPDPAALVQALRDGQAGARALLVRGYGDHVRRVLVRVLGPGDPEHEDHLQEVFARAITHIKALERPDALKSWLASLAVFVARGTIRKRRRRRLFLRELPPIAVDAQGVQDAAREASRCVYKIFAAMPNEERIALALRKVDGMELTELAEVLGVSIGTVRRRLARAEERFAKLASRYEALDPWRRSP